MPKVTLARDGAVCEIVLDRPEVLNAVDRETIAALAAAAATAAEDAAVRTVLLRGVGTHFCAGGDIRMFGALVAQPVAERARILREIVGLLHPLLTALRHMPKPVVAAVQGAAAGFGLSLVLAADLAVAAEDAVFASGYINLATSPDGGMTLTLPCTVGLKRAAELVFLGERFDARRALELGIVNRVVSRAALLGEARDLTRRLAAGPAQAYAASKALLQASIGGRLDRQLEREAESFAACAMTEDFVEGVRAFLAKRRPHFSGAARGTA
jgi:2-(1,2-epoxy-1,2-dihydrophenyl)acetyl-CoA isomerase